MRLSVNRALARESYIDGTRPWHGGVPDGELMLSAALDSLNVGIVVGDRGARVLYANAAARGGPLRFRGKSIAAATPDETRQLIALIQEAAAGAQWGAMCLSGRNGEAGSPALIRPLDANAAGRRGLVLVVLGARELSPWINAATLAKLYQLSQTQASIAIAIFQGQSPEEIASERGIRISTVRTHLAAVFQRTRSKTQRDLIRLIGSLPPLLP